MYLFKEGEELDVEHPPDILHTQEMTEAMQVLQHFAENEARYLLYQKRLDTLRVEATWKGELERMALAVKESERLEEMATRRAEQERLEKEEATRRAEQERLEKEEATRHAEQERLEKERLLALLKQVGLELAPPNAEE